MMSLAVIFLASILIAAWSGWRGFAGLRAAAVATVAYVAVLTAVALAQYAVGGLGSPLVDGVLLRADRAVGVDWAGVYRWAWASPVAGVLAAAYRSTFQVLWVVLVVVAFRDRARLWRIMGAFAGCAVVSVVLFAAFPAVGPAATLGVPDYWDGFGLRYSVDGLLALRAGGGFPGVGAVQGLMFFPSFHAVALALTVVGARALPRVVGWPVVAWSAVGLAAVVPVGGHYLVDVMAGAGLAAVALWRPVRAAAWVRA